MDTYVFQEMGKGCGKHPDPSCLCDVKPLPAGVPIRHLPRLAPLPASFDSPGNPFEEWVTVTLTRFEALAGINEAELNEALALWEGKGGVRADKRASQRQTAAKKCIRAGLTFEQTARWLSAGLVEVLDLFYPRERHELILEMEKYIRAGLSAQEVHEATGCGRRYAADVAYRWGVKLPHSMHRYTPEIRQKAIDLVQSGKSRKAAARELAVSESRVTLWCKHLPDGRKRK